MYKTTVKLTAHKHLEYANEIGLGSAIVGNVQGQKNFKIAGTLQGNISEATNGQGTLVIDRAGALLGDIKYSNLIVIGRIEGSIEVAGRIEVYPSAVILGNIRYKQINIHPDAKVNGVLSCVDLDVKNTEQADVINLHQNAAGT
jgi:cytoskeletal protein CcmA (bactofilin family)